MVEKDNYATTSPLNEGAGATNTYMSNTPFGNVKIYDLDAQIQPIQRIDIAPNIPNLPPVATTVATETETENVATIAPMKKPNYLLYGGGALVIGLVAYKLFKK
jgi:hypothetical protein